MPRPKKEKPNRQDGLFEVKLTLGKTMDGKAIRKSFYSNISKEDAKAKAKEYEIVQRASSIAGVNQIEERTRFDVWARTWLEKYKLESVKASTYKDTYQGPVEKYLIPYFGKSLLKDIKPIDIKSFYSEMSKKYYESTLKKVKLCLNAIFNTAIENDMCIKNPAKNVSYTVQNASDAKHVYTQEEVDLIIRSAKEHKYGLGIILLLKLGLRRSELVGVMWSDIDFKNKTIHVQRAVTVVNGKPVLSKTKSSTSNRILPIDNETTSVLMDAYQNRKESSGDGYIIGNLNDDSKFISPDTFVQKRYEKVMVFLGEKGIRRLSPHELRHTCGTLLYEKTNDIYAVSKFLGHADVNITTKIYVHDDVEMLRSALSI